MRKEKLFYHKWCRIKQNVTSLVLWCTWRGFSDSVYSRLDDYWWGTIPSCIVKIGWGRIRTNSWGTISSGREKFDVDRPSWNKRNHDHAIILIIWYKSNIHDLYCKKIITILQTMFPFKTFAEFSWGIFVALKKMNRVGWRDPWSIEIKQRHWLVTLQWDPWFAYINQTTSVT